jgi:hypothetical protein
VPRVARSGPLPRWALVADVLATALFVVALSVAITGGFVIWFTDEMRLSVRFAGRPFLFACIIAAIRFYLVRQPSPLWTRLIRPRPPLPLDEHRLFEPAPVAWWKRVGELLLVTAGCCGFIALATWPQVAQPYAVSDPGDPLFSVWRLMWVTHEFVRNPLNIFNGNQFYPEPRTLTFSDPVLTPAILFAPLEAIGLHRLVAYNIVFLSGGVFSGVSMYYLARALTGRRDAAWIAAAIFAMHPYRVEHFAHLELQMTMWIPVALWCLHRTLASARVRDGLATGAAFGAQFLSALYYGTFLIPFLFVIGGCLWIARGFPLKPLRSLAAGAVLAAVMFAPVFAVFLQTRPYMGSRPVATVGFYSAVGPDYLKAHYRSRTYGWLSTDAKPERSLFPRIAPIVLTGVALWPPLSVTRIAYALALALSVELSFGFNRSLFPLLYENVPPFGNIRVPARYSVVAGVALAVLSAYGAARLLGRWPRSPAVRGSLIAVMLAAISYEALPNMELVRPWLEPPPIYGSFTGKPPSVLAEFPMVEHSKDPFAEFTYLYFSTWHWQKLVNGQSGWLPPSYLDLLEEEKDFPSEKSIAYLRQRGVEYVGVHGAFYDPKKFAEVITALDARRDLELLTKAPWEGSESRLYRFVN